MMNQSIGVVIIGGTGYGAGELLRLLALRSDVEVVSVVSHSHANELLSDHHPHLLSFYEGKRFSHEVEAEKLSAFDKQIAFLSLPHSLSASNIDKLQARNLSNVKIIDLSADFRLRDKSVHERFYPDVAFKPELREKFVYGLPELCREEIVNASYIANPGCYATACILAAAPLMSEAMSGQIVMDAKSGTSGGGKQLSDNFHHPLRNSSMTSYKALMHRHEPEIREVLGRVGERDPDITFTPHLLPVSRGIFATLHFSLKNNYRPEELMERYQAFYKHASFVRIRKEPPELSYVVGSNFCDISVTSRGNNVVVFSALDNLVKGMAGQAIQNMNVMCGLDEATGLKQPALNLI